MSAKFHLLRVITDSISQRSHSRNEQTPPCSPGKYSFWVERAVSIMLMKCIINSHHSYNPSLRLDRKDGNYKSGPVSAGWVISIVLPSLSGKEMQMINRQGYKVFTQISWKQSIQCTTLSYPQGCGSPGRMHNPPGLGSFETQIVSDWSMRTTAEPSI